MHVFLLPKSFTIWGCRIKEWSPQRRSKASFFIRFRCGPHTNIHVWKFNEQFSQSNGFENRQTLKTKHGLSVSRILCESPFDFRLYRPSMVSDSEKLSQGNLINVFLWILLRGGGEDWSCLGSGLIRLEGGINKTNNEKKNELQTSTSYYYKNLRERKDVN